MLSSLVGFTFIGGIIFIAFGVFVRKSDPDSWVRSSTTWIEFPEWASYIYTGAFLIIGGIILNWLGL